MALQFAVSLIGRCGLGKGSESRRHGGRRRLELRHAQPGLDDHNQMEEERSLTE